MSRAADRPRGAVDDDNALDREELHHVGSKPCSQTSPFTEQPRDSLHEIRDFAGKLAFVEIFLVQVPWEMPSLDCLAHPVSYF